MEHDHIFLQKPACLDLQCFQKGYIWVKQDGNFKINFKNLSVSNGLE